MTKPTILVFLLLAFFGESISAVAAEAKVCDATLQDAARANREVPVRVRLPAVDGPTPGVIFSHSLGGNVDADDPAESVATLCMGYGSPPRPSPIQDVSASAADLWMDHASYERYRAHP